MAQSRPPRLDDAAVEAATARVLESRGFSYASTPDEGQDAYDITVKVREEVRDAVSSYLLAVAPLPEGAEELLDALGDVVFGGRLGNWQESADLRLVIEAMDLIRFLAAREKARLIDPLPLPELAALVQEKLKPLSGQHSREHGDLELHVHHCLTEPSCPTATIRHERSNALRYSAHRDTVVEAIVAAADLAHRELVLGQRIRPESPITNPDDRI